MDAARTRTGTSDQFLVWQLHVQGDSAIGDIQEVRGASPPGRRWLVAWERTGGSWTATFHTEFLDAERAATRSAAPYLSGSILGEMLFVEPFDVPVQMRSVAQTAADERSPEKIELPSRVPEGWKFTYRAADFGEPGGIPGTRHWHFQEYGDGSHTITHFIGSPEGAPSPPGSEPIAVKWGADGSAYLWRDIHTGAASIGYGDGSMGEWYYSDLWADADTPRLRAALSAMAFSMREVRP